MKTLAVACVVLVIALLLALWRIDSVSTSLASASDQVTTLENAAASRRNTQRLLADLDTQHTQELTNAQAQNKALLARVGTGAQRLSVPARCPAVRTATSPARVDDAEARAELDPASGQRIVATANDGDDAIRALNSLIDWVNTACLPRK